MSTPHRSPLHERHERLSATFTDFGGWSMPLRYGSQLDEHRAVREAAGLFDISHMAEFTVTGTGAADLLDRALAGRLSAVAVGRAKYSLVLADDGGIIDDVIVYRLAEERYLVIANAGNRAEVAAAFAKQPIEGAQVEDVTDRYALIAVQGPAAQRILEQTPSLSVPGLARLRSYAWAQGRFTADDVMVARTGYTGEDGFELLIDAESAGRLWDALGEAGRAHGLLPAGLAARDTLRLEAGMPLYGHELSRSVVPAQAGLGRVVAMAKDDFAGKAGLAALDPSDRPVLVGLVSPGRRAGRAGYAVVDAEGTTVGEITSGALSPTLGHPIAMAYVNPACAEPDTELTIDVRGTRIPATVTTLPFYRRKK